jgi:hypothetical protein
MTSNNTVDVARLLDINGRLEADITDERMFLRITL